MKNPSETMNKFMNSTLLSETKKEYINKLSNGKASVIKDKNLNFLKSSYKNMLRAWLMILIININIGELKLLRNKYFGIE